MDDLAIAFAERLDRNGFSYDAGLIAAEELVNEILSVAEDRTYAIREDDGDAEGR